MRARTGPDSIARYRAVFAERDIVAELEVLTARAWPPLTLLDLDGWQLRSAGGLSRRANSAWPRADGRRLGFDERMRQLEAFYVQGGLDPTVMLSPSARPTDLGGALRRRGYRLTAPVEVRTRRADLLGSAVPDGVALVGLADWLPHWAAATGAADRQRTMAARMLERAVAPAAYALLVEGRETAVARGVVDGGWLGVDLLVATPGLAAPATGVRLAAALGAWGVERGAAHAHLEVDDGDPGAVALTAGLGFRRAYTYRYAVRPRAEIRRA